MIRGSITIRSFVLAACAAGASSFVPPASAAEDARATGTLDYTARVGAAYSDNVNRSSQFPQDSASVVAGVDLAGRKEAGRLKYGVVATLERYEYLTSGLQGTNFGSGLGRASYDLVEDFFTWNASAAYDQMRENTFRPIAPGNTESSISWSTGPTLRARLSDVTRLELDGQYSRQDYSARPYDNQTIGGQAQLLRQSSSRTLFGLGYAYDDFSYIGGLGATTGLDFRRQEYFVTFNTRVVRMNIDTQVGIADVKGQVIDDQSPMARVRLSRRLTPSIDAFIGYQREYPTSLSTPIPREEILLSGLDDSALLSSTPRISNTGDAGLRYERERSSLALTYFNRSEKALVAGIGSHTTQEVRAEVGRRFTPTASGTFFVSRSDERYSLFPRKANEIDFGAAFIRDLGRHIGIEARVEYRDRSGLLRVDTYNELSGGVFLRYANRRDRVENELR